MLWWVIISAQFIVKFPFIYVFVNFVLLLFFFSTKCHQMKGELKNIYIFNKALKRGRPPHSKFQSLSEGLKAAAVTYFSHRNNKWSYSACMGEWINQQRCCILWNATINHRGLMSGRGKGQRCMELWREDAPFVVIYCSESTETGAIVHSTLSPLELFLTLTKRNRGIDI